MVAKIQDSNYMLGLLHVLTYN